MPFFPTMFGLMNIDRLARGLLDLQSLEKYAPEENTPGHHSYPAEWHRHKPLHELAKSLADDLVWLNERGVSIEDGTELQADDFERAIKFLLRGSSDLDDYIAVEIAEEDQLPLTLEQRRHWAVARMTFHGDGWNWKFNLGDTHPAHQTMQTFLTAVQPMHCSVIANVVAPSNPDHIPYYFPRYWTRVSRNCFLGPELTRRLPAALLTVEAGLAYVARLGEGVWITLPGDDRSRDEAVEERHRQAVERLNAFMPPASPFDPSRW